MLHRRLAGPWLGVLAVLTANASAQTPALNSAVNAQIDRAYPALQALYEDIHSHPEIAFEEVRTAAKLAAEMRALGFTVTEGVGKTGLVAIFENGAGPTVMVRTELDALPMEERPACPMRAAPRPCPTAARASSPTAAATMCTWPPGWARRAPWSR